MEQDRKPRGKPRSEEHTSELQSHHDLVCRLLLEKKKPKNLGINLPKEAKDLYSENYKMMMKEIKDNTNRGEIYCALGLEEAIL